mmetsp:Transcript_31534/g.99133  ORF Transcript_31534/g.99133 Transcript_31534/m.99133 type:complete len:541 (-) Transcript_31534:51-1673(-)
MFSRSRAAGSVTVWAVRTASSLRLTAQVRGCGGGDAVRLQDRLRFLLGGRRVDGDDGGSAHALHLEGEVVALGLQPLHERVHLPQVEDALAVDGEHPTVGEREVPRRLRAGEHARKQHWLLGRLALRARQHELHELVRRVLLPVVPPLVQVRLDERHEDEAGVDEVREGLVVGGRRDEPLQRPHGNLELELLSRAQHAQADGLVRKLEVYQVRKGEPLLPPDGKRAVVGDGVPVQLEEDVACPEERRGGRGGRDAADADAGAPLHAEVGSQLRVVEGLPEDAERGEAGGAARVGGGVVDEVVGDDGRGDDVPDVLRVELVLEGDADHVTVGVEGGPAAVARVDGGVDLHREQVGARVGVPLDLDARDDALRDRDALASLRVPHHRNLVLQRRHRTKLERLDALPKGVVRHGESGEVALVRDARHLRHVLLRVARLTHLHVRRIGHTVGVCQDDELAVVLLPHREAGAGALLLRLVAPRHGNVDGAVHRVHLDHRLCRRRGRLERRQHRTAIDVDIRGADGRPAAAALRRRGSSPDGQAAR